MMEFDDVQSLSSKSPGSKKSGIARAQTIKIEISRAFSINESYEAKMSKLPTITSVSMIKRAQKKVYPNNRVVTTQYTCLNFLPKNLMVQFSKMANIYFLIIMILQFFPALYTSATDWVFTLLPLMLVVGVSMIKDIFEDNKRRKKDKEENYSKFLVCSDGNQEF